MESIEAARQRYAEELRVLAGIRSEPLVAAFATVPREEFLGPGPWRIFTGGGYQTTADANPHHLYHNVLVALDEARWLNNGEPRTLAAWIDGLDLKPGEHVVHIGCGVGYYTAIMAQVVGPTGRLTAIEIVPELAERAQENLRPWPTVEVYAGDGTQLDLDPADAIFINAGVTHPQPTWLEALRHGGRLLLPLTTALFATAIGTGAVFKVVREAQGFSACHLSPVGIFPCLGGRDTKLNEKLTSALRASTFHLVQSLRCDPHSPTHTCWLHEEQFCFSTLPLSVRTA